MYVFQFFGGSESGRKREKERERDGVVRRANTSLIKPCFAYPHTRFFHFLAAWLGSFHGFLSSLFKFREERKNVVLFFLFLFFFARRIFRAQAHVHMAKFRVEVYFNPQHVFVCLYRHRRFSSPAIITFSCSRGSRKLSLLLLVLT